MARRKTVSVAAMVEKVNRYLAAERPTAEMRRGAASVLEQMLMMTGNYHGYNYLAWMDGGYTRWVAAGSPQDRAEYIGDTSRRYYYASNEECAGAKLAKGGTARASYHYPAAIG